MVGNCCRCWVWVLKRKVWVVAVSAMRGVVDYQWVFYVTGAWRMGAMVQEQSLFTQCRLLSLATLGFVNGTNNNRLKTLPTRHSSQVHRHLAAHKEQRD